MEIVYHLEKNPGITCEGGNIVMMLSVFVKNLPNRDTYQLFTS